MCKLLTFTFLFLFAVFFLAAANGKNDLRSANAQKKPIVSEVHRSEDEEFSIEERNDTTGEPIGRWRSNGQALEPKWRDGDHAPRAPLRTSLSKILENTSLASFEARSSRRRRPPQIADNEARGINAKKGSGSVKVESTKSPKIPFPVKTFEKTESPEKVAIKYRETFQNQPSEYDMNDEEYQKPRPRKRRPPQNYEFAEIRSAYAIHQMERAPDENLELKMLLKEQQGKDLSLSEILQRSNYSLSDLLQGKADVINLLKMSRRRDHVIKMHEDEDLKRWRQITKEKGKFLPVNKGSVTISAQGIETTTIQQVPTISETPVEVTTTIKNVDTDFPDVLQIDESKKKTDPGAMDNLDEDEIMEFSDFSTKTGEPNPKPPQPTSTQVPQKTEKTTPKNVESLTTIDNLKKNPETSNEMQSLDLLEVEYQNDAPEVETERNASKQKTLDTIMEEMMKMQENSSSYERVLSRVEPQVRAEILELLSSGSSAKRLERLLKSRNMSIDELIALRQRGSSQVHLAEVSHQRRQKTLKKIPNENDVTEKKEPENPVEEQKLETQETRFPLPTNLREMPEKAREIFDIYTAFDTLPIAKDIKDELQKISEDLGNDTMSFVEVGRVQEILEQNSDSSYDKIFESEEKRVKNEIADKVKPSIIASFAILGVALVVFLAIFIICKMQQKEKYTYRNTFSRTVFQNPAIVARKLSNTSSLNTIMVNVVAPKSNGFDEFDVKSDIENDSLDGNDSWETIPGYMK